MSDLPSTFVAGFHKAEDVRKMKYNDFGNTGMKVSKLSLGAAGFSLIYGNYSLEECKETVLKAIKSGINYIDTSYWYGQNSSQEALGKCLQGIPREAYYLATKVGRYEKDPQFMFDFSAEKTRWSIENSLRTMCVEYIDVIQVHDLEFAPSIDYVIEETLPVLKEAVERGVAKFIGITGYPVSALTECIERSTVKIDMILSYSRLTLIDDTLMNFIPIFKDKNIGIINGAGLAMGLLTNNGPQPWHPANDEIKTICREAGEYCKSKGVELARLAMHYLYDISGPDTQLVGMNTLPLLDANLDVLLNGLSKDEIDILEYVRKKIFSKLNTKHWEGVELEERRELIK